MSPFQEEDSILSSVHDQLIRHSSDQRLAHVGQGLYLDKPQDMFVSKDQEKDWPKAFLIIIGKNSKN